MMPNYLIIQIAGAAPPGLADELADELGVYPHIEPGSGRAVDPMAAEVVISTAAGAFFGSLVTQFGVRAADQLCQGFGRLVKLAQRVTSRESVPQAIFVEETTGVRCVLEPGAVAVPKAMQALLELDYGAYAAGATIRWHPQSSRWTADSPSR
jgi:hypothetical protein